MCASVHDDTTADRLFLSVYMQFLTAGSANDFGWEHSGAGNQLDKDILKKLFSELLWIDAIVPSVLLYLCFWVCLCASVGVLRVSLLPATVLFCNQVLAFSSQDSQDLCSWRKLLSTSFFLLFSHRGWFSYISHQTVWCAASDKMCVPVCVWMHCTPHTFWEHTHKSMH